MKIHLPLLFLAAISLPLSTYKATGAEEGLTLSLLACETAKEPLKVFLESKGSKSDVFELPGLSLSEPMAVSARTVELKSADGDVALCDITVPEKGKSFAVLLAPKEPEGFEPIVVRRDDDTFKAGDFYFINRSGKTVVLKLGATELVLEAGDVAKSRPTEPVHNHHYNITMSTRGESGDKTIASTRWPVENSNRSYVIFLTAANGRTSYRSVDEFVEETGGGKKR